MNELPQLITDEPIIIPAVEAKVYDRYWLRLMTITSPSPTAPCRCYAEFQPYRNDNGVAEIKPEVDGDIKVLAIDNLFGLENLECEPLLTPETRQLALQTLGMVLQTMKMVARDKVLFQEST